MIGRFISADISDVLTVSPTALTDKNLYAYCDNNPIMRVDSTGDFWNVVIGATIGAAISAVTTAVDSYMTNGRVDWATVAISATVGAISGGIAATGLGTIAQASVSASASGAGSIATDIYKRSQNPTAGKFTLKDGGRIALKAVKSAAIGFGSSVFGSAIGNGATKKLNARADNMIFRGSRRVGYMTRTQARNLVVKGRAMKNTARGLSSVIGNIFSWSFFTPFS